MTPGQTVDVECLAVQVGDTVALDRVLLIGDGGSVTAGTPLVAGAQVEAVSQGEYKDDKVIVFKFKAKGHYRRKTGHRQTFTRLLIERIVTPGTEGEPEQQPPQEKEEVMASGT